MAAFMWQPVVVVWSYSGSKPSDIHQGAAWQRVALFFVRAKGNYGKTNAVTTPHDPRHTPIRPPQPGLLQECGATWPRPAVWTRPPDAHLTLALVLALPVWLALGLGAGGVLRAPVGGWAWVSLVLLQPVLEELAFRGVLQGLVLRLTQQDNLPRRVGPITLANVLVSIGFAVLHLRAQPLAWALAVVAPSLVLGHLRERFSSVWPAVLVHAFYNTGFGVVAWLAI
jgi:membrane protease YdiL (CAAX protease family)